MAFKKSKTNEPINTRVFGDLVFVKLSWKFAAADSDFGQLFMV